jgi:hypothetical protein
MDMRSIFALLACALAVVATTASYAASRYDGIWSVSLITDKGDCTASYRYPMLVANGVVGNAGSADIVVRGSVAPSGAVRVVVRQGNTSAAGYGRLFAAVGRGSWRGASCSGSWTAERRNSQW